MRTLEEIAEQVKHLKAIKPGTVALNAVVARRIRLCIHALESAEPLDTKALDLGDQMCVWAAERWKSGIVDPAPAEDWPKEKA